MTIADWLMITAVLLAPAIAVQAAVFLERRRQRRSNKNAIFQSLMATRMARLSPRHVEALNMIELEFYGETKVVAAWRIYRDHLSRSDVDQSDFSAVRAWTEKGNDLFVELLKNISNHLNYRFDHVDLNRGAYSPIAHGEEEMRGRAVRQAVFEVLDGKRSVPIFITNSPASNEPDTPIDDPPA